ncbi:ATP-binding protein [Thermithiobacillus tepidarius DSM 3134]|uniref:ATP-binding protein n=1 Tax=Thermithiobacillus tepidarius TaxID=929 RepID=UPI00040318D1|nr:ATP-binding protein [Thermithiobacillus tepidarius]
MLTHTPPATQALASSFRWLAGLLLLFAALYGAYAWHVEQQEEQTRLRQLSDFAARSADQFFDHYASGLYLLGRELQDAGAPADLAHTRALLLRFQQANPDLLAVHLIAPDGRIAASISLAPGQPSPDLRAVRRYWPHFQSTLAGQGLNVLPPLQGPLTRQWVIPLQYPVRDARGRVQFVLSATLPLDNQQAIWRTLALPPGTVIGLVRQDGFFQSLWPSAWDPVRTYSRPADCPVAHALRDEPRRKSGIYSGQADACGPDKRLGAYHRLAQYPFAAFVSIPYGFVQRAWLSHIQVPFGLLLFLGLGGYIVYRLGLRWQRASERERKRAEDLTTRLGRIIDSVFNEIYTFDAQSLRFVQVSQGALHNLGYSMEELRRMTPVDLHPISREEFEALIEPLRSGRQQQVVFESVHRRKDGSLYPVEVRLQLSAEESPPVFVAIHEDISERQRAKAERRQAEAEIRQLNAELERRVAERTAELSAVNQELESFSYSVSHDLRAPLRGIDGFSRAVLEDCGDILSDSCRQDLERVRAASQRMAQLIDDLLQLAQATRGELRREPVNLSDLARRIATNLYASEPEREVEFHVAPDVIARGDPRLLQVVLENLLGNAWKFTGKHANARIEFGAFAQDGQTVYFVRDNGAGFDMAYAGKLFGAFQRLHGASEFEGTGVGLAIVQRIIRRHGGRIWAESTVGQGATFCFTLGGAG